MTGFLICDGKECKGNGDISYANALRSTGYTGHNSILKPAIPVRSFRSWKSATSGKRQRFMAGL